MTNVDLPKNIQFIDHGSHLEIVRVWRGWMTLYFAAFTGFWWFVLSGFFENMPKMGDSWITFLPLLHVGAGIFLIYYTIASLFNKTHIFADSAEIEVRHRPIPWLGNRRVDAADITQLYVKQAVRSSGSGTNVSYQLKAKTQSGKEIKMLSGLSSPEQAIFVEDKLEDLLKIKNQRIRGEY
jgi:hypothetical protein